MQPNTDASPTPQRDWSATLDLDRKTITRNFVSRMEECMRAAEVAAEDLKGVLAEAKAAEFGPRDIAAMKKIAKMRLKDQGGAAREQLEALSRIGKAVAFDLFDWADDA
jgi:uncharacterized protein (UPF0335 family)